METTVLSITKPFDINKDQIQEYANIIINDALSGNEDLLLVAKKLRAMTDCLKIINEKLKSNIQDEIAKYGKDAEIYGCKFTNTQKTTYDFSECGDSEHNDLLKQKIEIEEKIADKETFLKSLKQKVFIEATGEEVVPPIPTITSYFTLKIK